MRTNLVVVMDDISAIQVAKDTSLAMLLEGQRRGYRLWYLNETDLYISNGRACAGMREVEVRDDPADWYRLGQSADRPLGGDDLVMMRSDPPVDTDYLMATYVLGLAEQAGARVVNRPQALRDFNEKLATMLFPDLIPATLVSANATALRDFVDERGRVVLKPLDGMGGQGIFVLERGDPNINVVIETLTANGRNMAMAQEYLAAIDDGDKRVLVIGGKPADWMLARIPSGTDFRGNVARGARAEGRPLTDVERNIALAVGPALVKHGIQFAGLDIIGDRLTEINVTSPTCVRELDARFGVNILSDLFDVVDP
ncbi:MAG TPA: glutathione synthase [Wenzhouxiangella sp.]|nr:glutathione synthase [Wenzhouxiangella sp.]